MYFIRGGVIALAFSFSCTWRFRFWWASAGECCAATLAAASSAAAYGFRICRWSQLWWP